MKILLDACVPWPLHTLLTGHECTKAARCGWGGLKNGELLKKAEGNFALFITADQYIRYQRNLAGRALPILELSTNDLRRIRSGAGLIHHALEQMEPGRYRRLEIP
jgi:hypothetical protein